MNTLKCLFFIILTLSLIACNRSSKEAVNYYYLIVEHQNEILEKENNLRQIIFQFVEEVNESSQEKTSDEKVNIPYSQLDSVYIALTNQIKESIIILRRFPFLEKKTYLKNAAMDFLATYKSVTDNEYSEVIFIVKIPAENYTDGNHKRFNDLFVKTINLKLNKAHEDLIAAQNAFAAEYNFEVE